MPVGGTRDDICGKRSCGFTDREDLVVARNSRGPEGADKCLADCVLELLHVAVATGGEERAAVWGESLSSIHSGRVSTVVVRRVDDSGVFHSYINVAITTDIRLVL